MSISLMSAVFAYGPKEPTARLVLLVLADFANNDGESIFPSYATIAERAAISRRQAMRVVDRLIADGYLTASPRRHENGRAESNEYRIVVGRLGAHSDTHGTNHSDTHGTNHSDTHDTNHSDTHDTNMVTPMTPDPPYDPSKLIHQREQQPAAARAPGPLEKTLRSYGVKSARTVALLHASGWSDDHEHLAHIDAVADSVAWAHSSGFRNISDPAAFLVGLLREDAGTEFVERCHEARLPAGLEAVLA